MNSPSPVPSAMACALWTIAIAASGCGASEESGEGENDRQADSVIASQKADAGAPSAWIPTDCATETRADVFKTGMNKATKTGTVVALVAATPAPPARNDNAWVFDLTDADGDQLLGASITLSPYMPDHGHGSPREPVVEELGEGRYSAEPIAFFMPGYWRVVVNITPEGLPAESADFGFCVP